MTTRAPLQKLRHKLGSKTPQQLADCLALKVIAPAWAKAILAAEDGELQTNDINLAPIWGALEQLGHHDVRLRQAQWRAEQKQGFAGARQ